MTEPTNPATALESLEAEISRVLIGNEGVVERLTIALLTDGHVLLEGVPGVAKTTIAELFARATGLTHNRIQLTPDSLPADITGTTIYRDATGEFEVQKGPVFANVVVADEINRATPKTQSALLEAMQERRVTIEGESFALPEPFIVVATQNPLEMEGTFELPEAQRDRFQFKLEITLPDREDEEDLLERFDDAPDLGPRDVTQVIDPAQIPALRQVVADVHVAPSVKSYVLDVVDALRENPSIEHGPSPRASITLQRAAKARAAIRSRRYVLPEDVKQLAVPVLAHRLVLGTDATLSALEPAGLVADALERVEAPGAGSLQMPDDTDRSTDVAASAATNQDVTDDGGV